MAKFDQMDHKEIRKYLAAFADGELDVEQNLCVLEQMAMNPQATRRVMHQQQLRQVVDRAMREMTPPVSDDLRARLENLAEQTPATVPNSESENATPSDDGKPTVLARIAPWVPAIAAAILLAASATFWFMGQPQQTIPSQSITVVRAPKLLDSRRIDVLESRHVACTKRIEELHNAALFGRVIADVPAKMTNFLGEQTTPVLDLSALGYQFSGAGECAAPGAKAVHLVYREQDAPVATEALSLWVRADKDHEIKIQSGKLYEVPRPNESGSIVMWRRNEAVYYLVGDAAEEVKNAALALQEVDK